MRTTPHDEPKLEPSPYLAPLVASEKQDALYLHRPYLTGRVVGRGEAYGLQIEKLFAIADHDGELFVFWRGMALASARAWCKAERELKLPRRATHLAVFEGGFTFPLFDGMGEPQTTVR